jgi:hypothetical protein
MNQYVISLTRGMNSSITPSRRSTVVMSFPFSSKACYYQRKEVVSRKDINEARRFRMKDEYKGERGGEGSTKMRERVSGLVGLKAARYSFLNAKTGFRLMCRLAPKFRDSRYHVFQTPDDGPLNISCQSMSLKPPRI